MRNYASVSAAVLIVAALGASPALAQLDVDLGILDARVDVDTDRGLHVDADVNLLGDRGVDADANVALGGDRAADVAADVNVGGSGGIDASANVGVGGDDGLLDADVDIGVGGGSNGSGGNGGGGGGGTPPVVPPSGSGAQAGGSSLACEGENSSAYARLTNISYSTQAVSNWSQATSVQFIPVSLCPGLDAQLGTGLLAQAAGGIPVLQSALAGSSYSANDIIGIAQSGGQLAVYVN
ncbi:hypothetical protein [Pelagibacterium lacus]|uniref:Uncharacterized protein n=1 Tax=Pelagibacterium lacus TaxID=2282655 RepID=A0A369W672_9HYPH|nr:hypothetical protein [Pelagibacterium lacus]RDE10174.1 hypothetical protein DVH29_01900 [Pelagibacterium lacus]